MPKRLFEFQAEVFDILSMALSGIHNAPVCWEAIQWKGDAHGTSVPVNSWGDFSTLDSAELTYVLVQATVWSARYRVPTHGL